GASALLPVPRGRQGAEGHAVEGVGEGDDVAAAGDLAGELEARLDSVGAGGPREHHLVIQLTGFQDPGLEELQEATLRGGGHVEPVGDPRAGDVLDEPLLEGGIVVPVVEGPSAGEEVEVAASSLVEQL